MRRPILAVVSNLAMLLAFVLVMGSWEHQKALETRIATLEGDVAQDDEARKAISDLDGRVTELEKKTALMSDFTNQLGEGVQFLLSARPSTRMPVATGPTRDSTIEIEARIARVERDIYVVRQKQGSMEMLLMAR